MRALMPRLEGYALTPAANGASGARVWRCTFSGAPSYYLKAASPDAWLDLEGEAARLRWMRSRGVRVPAIAEYLRDASGEYLLLEEARGGQALDPESAFSPNDVVEAIGRALAALHRVDIVDCPFDHCLARRVEAAREQVLSGRVNAHDFDESRIGRTASALLGELLSRTPPTEDVVLTHGDIDFENVLIEREADGSIHVTFIDCARAGVADRYQDLALAVRCIEADFGERWVSPFLDAYDVRELDSEKVEFYQLLDEFF